MTDRTPGRGYRALRDRLREVDLDAALKILSRSGRPKGNARR